MDMITPRPRLSANALGITPNEHRALIQFRDHELGTIVHDRDQAIPDGEFDGATRGLNMDIVLDEGSCGTTGCIAGWMFMIIRKSTGQTPGGPDCSPHSWATRIRSKSLGPLFMPMTDLQGRDLLDEFGNPIDFPYEHIDIETVKMAIDNFFATGDPDYPGILQIEA